jgi:hypothetical protein
MRLEEEERKANEEIERLKNEEKSLRPWRDEYEKQIGEQLSKMKEKEDWDKYSNCKEGYINVNSEKELNGFIYEFKQRCDSVNTNKFIQFFLFRILYSIFVLWKRIFKRK